MKLDEAIEVYTEYKRANGVAFLRGPDSLRGLRIRGGNVELADITASDILPFLNGPRTSNQTYRSKHSLLRYFFEHFAARGVMPAFKMPPNRPYHRATFAPYIYSRDEVGRILKIARTMSPTGLAIAPHVFAMLLLTLYATGASASEVFRLRCDDVDLVKGTIRFGPGAIRRGRVLPLAKDFVVALRKYDHQRSRKSNGAYFFTRKDGAPLKVGNTVAGLFRRIVTKAGISRHDGIGRYPRLHDLRATFAVHRISSWIKKRANLGRLLPALAVYLGNAGLARTERYLTLTPERFRKELKLLSPTSGKRRWREDSELMGYLQRL